MNDDTRYTIDDLVALTGFSRRTIRFYVERGLLEPPVGRGKGAFYHALHLARLREIQRARREGRSLASLTGTGQMNAHAREVCREQPGLYAVCEEPVQSAVGEPSLLVRYALAPHLYLEVDVSEEMRYRSLIATILSLVRREIGPVWGSGKKDDHEDG